MIRKYIAILIAQLAVSPLAQAADPDWSFIRPSNTGIPGEEVRFAHFDPAGRLWVAARVPFYREGGVGIYDGTSWTVHNNYESPIPTDIINGIAFDIEITWLGTDRGLVRIADTGWTVYNPSNSPLPTWEIESPTLDAAGNLWMVYNSVSLSTSGVARFDGSNWTTWSHTSMGFDVGHIISELAIDSNGDVYLGTLFSGGMARFDGTSWSVLDGSTGHSNAPARALTTGEDGHVWAIWGGGITRLEGETWVNKPNPPESIGSYSTLHARADGTYYVGTYTGRLYHYTGSWATYTYGNHLYSIEVDEAGDVWCGGLAHVKRLDSNGQWTLFNSCNTGLGAYFMRNIEFDAAGRAWYATGGFGACSYDGTGWRNFNQCNGGSEPWPFGNDSADDVVAAPNGDMWVALRHQAVGQWNGTEWTHHLEPATIWAMDVDPSGTVWAGPYNSGIAKYDGTSWEVIPDPITARPLAMKGPGDGTLWVGSEGGLFRWDGTDWDFWLHTNTPLPSSFITSLDLAPDGTLWIGTNRGVAHFDGVSEWTVYQQELPDLWVNALVVADDGTVWAASYDAVGAAHPGGLSRFDGVEWVTYTRQNSPLPHNQIEALEIAPNGDLYIATASEGVAIIHTQETAGVDSDPVFEVLSGPVATSYPNPFTGQTTIGFTNLSSGHVALNVFDINGRHVETLLDGPVPPGNHEVRFDGSEQQPGIYFYRLETESESTSGRVTLVK